MKNWFALDMVVMGKAPELPELESAEGKKWCAGHPETHLPGLVDRKEFRKAKGKADGLRSECKACEKAKTADRKQAKIDAENKKAKKEKEELVNDFQAVAVNDGTEGESFAPRTTELLEAVMEDVGGLREFAGIVSDHLKNAPDGSVQKGRAIDVMTRLVDKHTKSEEEAEPLAVKDEGELHRMLEEKLLLLAQRNGLRIVVNPVDGTDGSEQEKTEGTAASPAPS